MTAFIPAVSLCTLYSHIDSFSQVEVERLFIFDFPLISPVDDVGAATAAAVVTSAVVAAAIVTSAIVTTPL